MTISGTVQLSGRVRYVPTVPNVNWSANPTWMADVLEAMPCSSQKEEQRTLMADGDASIDMGSLGGVANLIVIKVQPMVGIPPSPGFPLGVPAAPNPVTVKLTGAAGAAQAVTVDGFMFLLSAGSPYTAMSVARAPGIQTVVVVQLFVFGS